jgi:hypothetical protein
MEVVHRETGAVVACRRTIGRGQRVGLAQRDDAAGAGVDAQVCDVGAHALEEVLRKVGHGPLHGFEVAAFARDLEPGDTGHVNCDDEHGDHHFAQADAALSCRCA